MIAYTTLMPLVQGLFVGLGLILAIGAQNAFVLRQGLKGDNVAVAVSICAASDAFLISLGAAGVGTFVAETPELRTAAVWAGSTFLIVYGGIAFRSAISGGNFELEEQADTATGVGAVAMSAFALSLMNPHAWLDTVVILGSVAGNYTSMINRFTFASGAILASLVFFVTLGYGSSKLAPLFRYQLAWRLLDVSVAVVMWSVAASLVVPELLG